MAIETGGAASSAPRAPIAKVIDGLNDLLRLDHDAVAAYEVAVDGLEDRELAVQIEGFKQDHLTHIRRLNDLVVRLGGTPANEPHVTGPLKEAIVRAGGTAGDRGLLLAWRANELQAMMKYDRYAQRAVDWPADVKRVIDENALDEERHYRWVVDVLGVADPLEIDLTNRARESVTRMRIAGDSALRRTARIGTAARERAAGWLDDLTDRLGAATGDGDRTPRRRIASGIDSTASVLRGDRGVHLTETVAGGVRGNFGRSLGGAFAVGFLLGRLIR